MEIQKLINNFIQLGNDYKKLSQKYFGWNDTYIDLVEFILTEDYQDSNTYRFYFADSTDFTSTTINGIDINYHPTPIIEFQCNKASKLEELYKEALETFEKVEKNMLKQKVYREQDEKKQKIDRLQQQIKELQK